MLPAARGLRSLIFGESCYPLRDPLGLGRFSLNGRASRPRRALPALGTPAAFRGACSCRRSAVQIGVFVVVPVMWGVPVSVV